MLSSLSITSAKVVWSRSAFLLPCLIRVLGRFEGCLQTGFETRIRNEINSVQGVNDPALPPLTSHPRDEARGRSHSLLTESFHHEHQGLLMYTSVRPYDSH